jgi:hypothetical protein
MDGRSAVNEQRVNVVPLFRCCRTACEGRSTQEACNTTAAPVQIQFLAARGLQECTVGYCQMQECTVGYCQPVLAETITYLRLVLHVYFRIRMLA